MQYLKFWAESFRWSFRFLSSLLLNKLKDRTKTTINGKLNTRAIMNDRHQTCRKIKIFKGLLATSAQSAEEKKKACSRAGPVKRSAARRQD
jgi:hypothetical protein